MSGPGCLFSHACNLVLLEKDVECNLEYVPKTRPAEKLLANNPYGETPTLLDREVVLYDPVVIVEYFDERFPHPPLRPADPINRAKVRLLISHFIRDWLQPISKLKGAAAKKWPVELRKSIRDGLSSWSPVLARQEFFAGAEYTIADAYLAPLLWRMKNIGFALPKQAAPLLAYGERMFKREAFIRSLAHPKAALR